MGECRASEVLEHRSQESWGKREFYSMWEDAIWKEGMRDWHDWDFFTRPVSPIFQGKASWLTLSWRPVTGVLGETPLKKT